MIPTAALLGAGGDPALPGNEGRRTIHAVQFYEEEEALIDRLADFFGAALGGGEACVMVASPPRRLALLWRLQKRGLNVEQIVDEGRFCLLDARDTLASICVDGRPVRNLFLDVVGGLLKRLVAKGQGRQRLALFGDMVALLWEEGKAEEAIQLEEMWNALGKQHLFSLLCAYPMRSFSKGDHRETFRRICNTHTHSLPCESYGRLTEELAKLRMVCELQQKASMVETVLERQHEVELELREAEEMTQTLLEDSQGTVAVSELRRILEPLWESFMLAKSADGLTPEASVYLESVEEELAKFRGLIRQSLTFANPRWRN